MTHKERSYFLPGLTAADRKLLAGVPRDASLADEIAYLRLRISKLAERPDALVDEKTAARERRETDSLLVRMLELLTRMVSVQAKLGEDTSDALDELSELTRQRLIEAASKASEC